MKYQKFEKGTILPFVKKVIRVQGNEINTRRREGPLLIRYGFKRAREKRLSVGVVAWHRGKVAASTFSVTGWQKNLPRKLVTFVSAELPLLPCSLRVLE